MTAIFYCYNDNLLIQYLKYVYIHRLKRQLNRIFRLGIRNKIAIPFDITK